jgi:hypothetical protein
MSPAKVFQTAVTTKRRSFLWEDEYRMISNSAIGQAVELPEDVIDSVGLGLGTSKSDIRLTKQILKTYTYPIRLLKAYRVIGNEVDFYEISVT